MILQPSGIENHPSGDLSTNAIINGDWALINDMFSAALGLTASQAAAVVTASGAIFRSDDVGATIRFADGTLRTITVYNSGTSVDVTGTGTVASQAFSLYRLTNTAADAIMRGLTKVVRMTTTDHDGFMFKWDQTTKRLVPVVTAASANQAALALDANVNGGDTVDLAAINANFAAIQTLVNQVRTDLIAHKLIKGSA